MNLFDIPDELRTMNGRALTESEDREVRLFLRNHELLCIVSGCNCSPEIMLIFPEVGKVWVHDGRATFTNIYHQHGCPMYIEPEITDVNMAADYLISFDQMNQDRTL